MFTDENEVWRRAPIVTKYPYEVSNMGRLRSVEIAFRVGPSRTRPMGYKKNYPQRIKKVRFPKKGYAETSLDGKPYRVHRLIALAFLPDGGPLRNQVNHVDGNKRNNCASNLEWVTHHENMAHAVRSGLIDLEGCARGGLKGGPANRGKRRSAATRARLSDLARARIAANPEHQRSMTDAARLVNLRASREKKLWCARKVRGTVWITDGVECRRVAPDALMPDGWQRGRTHTRKHVGVK